MRKEAGFGYRLGKEILAAVDAGRIVFRYWPVVKMKRPLVPRIHGGAMLALLFQQGGNRLVTLFSGHGSGSFAFVVG